MLHSLHLIDAFIGLGSLQCQRILVPVAHVQVTGAGINLNLKLRSHGRMEECQYSMINSFEPVRENIPGVGIVALSGNKQ